MNHVALLLAIQAAQRDGFPHFAAALTEILRREIDRTTTKITTP